MVRETDRAFAKRIYEGGGRPSDKPRFERDFEVTDDNKIRMIPKREREIVKRYQKEANIIQDPDVVKISQRGRFASNRYTVFGGELDNPIHIKDFSEAKRFARTKGKRTYYTGSKLKKGWHRDSKRHSIAAIKGKRKKYKR